MQKTVRHQDSLSTTRYLHGFQYYDKVLQFFHVSEGYVKNTPTTSGTPTFDYVYQYKDHLEVIVFMLKDGKMPYYDDKTKTLHLKQLSKLVMTKASKQEINANAEYFTNYIAKNELERKLLKEAKELRLCLKHFDEIQ